VRDDTPTVRLGAAVAALGAALTLAMFLQPQALRVPAPIGYLAGLAFVLAGWTIVARAQGHVRLKAWLPVLLLACMVTPAIWLAFGSGQRQCTLGIARTMARIFGARSDLACRIGFAVAAVVGIALVLAALWQALRSSRAP
jgi:hypothetical protein